MAKDFLALQDGKISINEISNNTWNHLLFGLTLLALMVVRLLLRFFKGSPKPTAKSPFLIIILARITHILFYMVLFVIPISGFLAWNSGNSNLGNIHTNSVNVLYGLVLLHLLATIYHQLILEDNLINRMTSFR
jgi:cytochrome b561